MINITSELVLITMCCALLAGAHTSQASNVYNVVPTEDDGAGATDSERDRLACPNEYWVCPSEALPAWAKETDSNVRTDAPVSDKPEQPAWSQEDERRYYDYSPMILGD